MNYIYDSSGKIIATGKNLAVILRSARTRQLISANTTRGTGGRGVVWFLFHDGSFSSDINFASHTVLVGWLNARRSWGKPTVEGDTFKW